MTNDANETIVKEVAPQQPQKENPNSQFRASWNELFEKWKVKQRLIAKLNSLPTNDAQRKPIIAELDALKKEWDSKLQRSNSNIKGWLNSVIAERIDTREFNINGARESGRAFLWSGMFFIAVATAVGMYTILPTGALTIMLSLAAFAIVFALPKLVEWCRQAKGMNKAVLILLSLALYGLTGLIVGVTASIQFNLGLVIASSVLGGLGIVLVACAAGCNILANRIGKEFDKSADGKNLEELIQILEQAKKMHAEYSIDLPDTLALEKEKFSFEARPAFAISNSNNFASTPPFHASENNSMLTATATPANPPILPGSAALLASSMSGIVQQHSGSNRVSVDTDKENTKAFDTSDMEGSPNIPSSP